MKNLTSKQIYAILNELCIKVIEPKLIIFNDCTLENTKKGVLTQHFEGNFDYFNDSFSTGNIASLNIFSDKTLASLIENQVKMLICEESNRFLLWSPNGKKISIALDGIWIMADNYRKLNDQNNTTKHTPKTVLVDGQILAKVSFGSDADKAKLQKHIDSGKVRFIPNVEKKVTKTDKSMIMTIANLLVIIESYSRKDAMIKAWGDFYAGNNLSEIVQKGKLRHAEYKAKKAAANEERRIIELISSLDTYKEIPTYKIVGYKSFIVQKLYEYRETKVINFDGTEYLIYLEPLIYELSKVA